MIVADRLTGIVSRSNELLDWLQGPLALFLRIYVGWQFFKSGLLKVSDWDSTLYLFHEEYHVPLLPPDIAAVTGAAGELVFPLFLWAGLCGRLAALGMSAVNVMAVVAYAHVLLSEGFEAALAQHVLWGTMLVILAVYGPGPLSVDALLLRRRAERLL